MFHNFFVGSQSRTCKSNIAIYALIIAIILPWSNHLILRLGEKSRRYSNRQDNLMNAARGKYTNDEMMSSYHIREISKYAEVAQRSLTFKALGSWTAGRSHIWRLSPRASPTLQG